MNITPEPLTAEEIAAIRAPAQRLVELASQPYKHMECQSAADDVMAALGKLLVGKVLFLCAAAETSAAQAAEIAALRTALADAGRAMDAAIAGIAALRQRAESKGL